jgi:hypothetical protein
LCIVFEGKAGAAPDLAKSLDGYNCQDIKPLYFGIPNLYGTFEVKRLYLS